MGQWIQRQPMPTPRHDLQAITVGSKIYAVSGAGDETVHAVEIYDPQSDSWESGPPIPTARGWFGAGLVNGAIYAIGGKRVRPEEEKRRTGDERHFEIRDSVERLDLAAGTWSAVESLSEPRAGLVATVCDGRIYAIGGNSMNNESGSGGAHLDRVEVFDAATGHWSPGVPLPLGLQGPAVAAVGGRIYVSAGIGGPEGGVNRRTFALDPDGGRWEELAPIPTGRCDPGVLAVGRRIYTFGGWGGDDGPYHARVEIYDVDADSWSVETPMADRKAWMASALVDGRIFVMGGAYKLADAPGYRWIEDLHELVP